jgi:hypothetical protein
MRWAERSEERHEALLGDVARTVSLVAKGSRETPSGTAWRISMRRRGGRVD